VKDKNKEKGEISRRNFLIGAGAVVIGGAIGAGITYPLVAGKEGEVTTVTKTVSVPTTITSTAPGTTVTTTATVDGGVVPSYLEPEETFIKSPHAPMLIDVKNGKIVRGRPVHWNSKYPDLKPGTITVRGKTWTAPAKSPLCACNLAYRGRWDSPNRILYPLQRVDWEPGGVNVNPQNRGISKYKRISWDEASDIIASELVRVADKYGTEAVSDVYGGGNGETKNVAGFHNSQTAFMHYYFLSKYGTTHTEFWRSPMTNTGGQVGGRYVFGHDYQSRTGITMDIANNAEMLLVWGGNPDGNYWPYPSGQIQGMLYDWFTELGIKQIYVTPDLNQSVGCHADKWIPVLPSTDCALFLAIAYTWFTEETWDEEYIADHAETPGFVKWQAYVMGDEDGVPKTPQWASPLCAVPVYTIKALAREWASKVTSIAYGRRGGGVGRAPYAHESQRMQLYLLAMQGWGAPGRHQVTGDLTIGGGATSPRTTQVGDRTKMAAAMKADLGISLSDTDRDRQFLSQHNLYNGLFNPPVYWWHSSDAFHRVQYPMEGKSEIHMIWGTTSNWTGGRAWGFRAEEAYRSSKLECIINQSIWLESGMVFCDIILPICTQFETSDITNKLDAFTSFILMKKAVEPRGESKTDFEAICEVAKKLGFLNEITGGKDAKEQEEEWIKEGYDTSRMTDLISWEELNEKGYHVQEADPTWMEEKPPALKFYQDPVANPLSTPTGLLEFESHLLLENFPDDKERPPLAHYILGGPEAEGWTHDESLSGERAKEYPLLVVSTTRLWGLHNQHTDIQSLREISHIKCWDGYAYSPLRINPVDAAARGIENGDIVRFYNERGSVLAAAVVAEVVIPGAVMMDQGGGGDNIIPTSVNRGGDPNAITPGGVVSTHAEGLAPTGWLCELEKVTGNQWEEWRKNYPEAFARDYDPAYGPLFSGWVEGGM